jgi:hypothetical protein
VHFFFLEPILPLPPHISPPAILQPTESLICRIDRSPTDNALHALHTRTAAAHIPQHSTSFVARYITDIMHYTYTPYPCIIVNSFATSSSRALLTHLRISPLCPRSQCFVVFCISLIRTSLSHHRTHIRLVTRSCFVRFCLTLLAGRWQKGRYVVDAGFLSGHGI